MDTKRLVILGVLFVFLVVLVIIFFNLGSEMKPKAAPPLPSDRIESSQGPAEPITIVLFFPSENDDLLHREEREIISESSEGEKAKRIIEEIFKGSKRGYLSPIPPETKLRELFITKDGVAYVDFSRDISEKHLSGSSAEISTIFSVVNSLSYNLKSVKKVFILIDGGERKTLGGHIDLTMAFSPQYDLVAN
ncbi:MAG: GerMN domain-containing protein [Candidatus Aminicenantes bacterium]|nr:GerMN domain-containing protein [Candidatus Aminicenantes bacterium]MDH5742162.1 GerMN domain-containing protein [Candidatus Aminicenantes bacterium]